MPAFEVCLYVLHLLRLNPVSYGRRRRRHSSTHPVVSVTIYVLLYLASVFALARPQSILPSLCIPLSSLFSNVSTLHNVK